MTGYDVIVVGLGGIGSAAAYHIARRGGRVLAMDRFSPPHQRGSSHGHTRLIRLAYFEHPDYVPLLRRAFTLWDDLAMDSGRRLLARTGLLLAGPADGEVIAGTDRSAREHALPIETLSPTEASRRWPSFRIPAGWTALFESQAGTLFVEQCVRAHVAGARSAGATLMENITVVGCGIGDKHPAVETNLGRFAADRIVLCPGAWADGILGIPGLSLRVLRKSLFWLRPPAAGPKVVNTRGVTGAVAPAFDGHDLPCFGFDTPEGFFYGMPSFDDRGVKVACHSGGTVITDPLAIDRTIDPSEHRAIDRWIDAHMPSLGHDLVDHAACLYTMSPDAHFVVGLHPLDERVTVADGFSGHGFKFASVIGEAIADLVSAGRSDLPIDFLSPLRDGIRSSAR
ncbi:MAG: N-methyl-L-tryptophan oxidase [Planctomycetaceae bacterium]